MLNLKYYLDNSVEKEEDRELLLKYFKKIKFETLGNLIYFFKNIENKISFVRDEKIRQKIIKASAGIEDRLSPLKLNYTKFLNDEVFPKLDYFDIARDLNPKSSGKSILLECPCCANTSKKHNKKNNRDAFVVRVGNQQTGTIKCNRANNCGETTSIVSHIMQREGLDFKSTVIKLAKSIGIDLKLYEKNLEIHLDSNNNSVAHLCNKESFNIVPKKKINNTNKYGLYNIDFKQADKSKSFQLAPLAKTDYHKLFIDKLPSNILKKLKKKYTEEKIVADFKKMRLGIVYSYIKKFTLKEKDREEMISYFANRGIPKESLSDVGCLKASKIKQLVQELKENFNEDELVEFGVLSEKYKSWKYGLVYTSVENYAALKKMGINEVKNYFIEKGIPKEYVEQSSSIPKKAISAFVNQLKQDFDEKELYKMGILNQKYKQNDSAVFFMHDIYSDTPTNMEFKFYGNLVKYSKRKAVSMANSAVVDSNYYGKPNNIDFIKNENKNVLWWTEGVIDSLTLQNFNIESNALIGVQKHYDRNIGQFKDKISVIAFDEDRAGHKEELHFAKKLLSAGVKNVFIAKWDNTNGKDLNDLMVNRKINDINIFCTKFDEESKEVVFLHKDIQKIPTTIINKGYEKANLSSSELPSEQPNEEKITQISIA